MALVDESLECRRALRRAASIASALHAPLLAVAVETPASGCRATGSRTSSPISTTPWTSAPRSSGARPRTCPRPRGGRARPPRHPPGPGPSAAPRPARRPGVARRSASRRGSGAGGPPGRRGAGRAGTSTLIPKIDFVAARQRLGRLTIFGARLRSGCGPHRNWTLRGPTGDLALYAAIACHSVRLHPAWKADPRCSLGVSIAARTARAPSAQPRASSAHDTEDVDPGRVRIRPVTIEDRATLLEFRFAMWADMEAALHHGPGGAVSDVADEQPCSETVSGGSGAHRP